MFKNTKSIIKIVFENTNCIILYGDLAKSRIFFVSLQGQTTIFVMNHDIFISYSSKQKSIADGVCHYLEENGFKCWMAPRDIPVGSEYGDLIEESIKACKVVVLVFSEAASISKWVKGEINVAFAEDKPILPFRIDETEITGGFRVMLNQMHWIDAFPRYADRLPELIKSICSIIGEQPLPMCDLAGHDFHGDETGSVPENMGEAIIKEEGNTQYTEVDKRILEVIEHASYSPRLLAAYEAQKYANGICEERFGKDKLDCVRYVEMLMAKTYPVELKKADLGKEYVAWIVKMGGIMALLVLLGIIIASIDSGDDVSFGVAFIVAVLIGGVISYVLYRKKMKPIEEKIDSLRKE